MGIQDTESRRKIYGITFLVSGLLLGLSGILVLWMPDTLDTGIINGILTLLIALAASSILFVLTFAQDDKISKKAAFVIGACTFAIAGLLLGDIWFDWFENAFLGKASVSLFVIACLAGFVLTVWDDFFENKKLKDENYLD